MQVFLNKFNHIIHFYYFIQQYKLFLTYQNKVCLCFYFYCHLDKKYLQDKNPTSYSGVMCCSQRQAENSFNSKTVDLTSLTPQAASKRSKISCRYVLFCLHYNYIIRLLLKIIFVDIQVFRQVHNGYCFDVNNR